MILSNHDCTFPRDSELQKGTLTITVILGHVWGVGLNGQNTLGGGGAGDVSQRLKHRGEKWSITCSFNP